MHFHSLQLAAKFGIKFIETNATKRYRGAIDIAIRTLSQDIKDKMDQQRVHMYTVHNFQFDIICKRKLGLSKSGREELRCFVQ
jgi:hypothetical protein